MTDKGAAPPATRTPGPGHNRPPIFGIHAAWLRFANRNELRRLATLQLRIDRKQQTLTELITERQLIMNRCTRRMRRSQGKQ